jgi:multidrug efflux pump subunit AcrA (membrane-fusion protein)
MSEATLPTVDELKTLPLRAIVCYAVRCARRVQPLYWQAREVAHREKHEAAIETALTITEQFCRGEHIAAADAADAARAAEAAADAADAVEAAAEAAEAAAEAARAARAGTASRAAAAAFAGAIADVTAAIARTADAARAARAAFAGATAGVTAATTKATGKAALAAARADYYRLVSVNLASYPDLGQPIDPTENGPLGPLWSAGPPAWFTQRSTRPVGAKGATNLPAP